MSYYVFGSGNISQNLDLYPENSVYKRWSNTSGVINPLHNNPATASTLGINYLNASATLWVRDYRLNVPSNANIMFVNANIVRKASRYGSIELFSAPFLTYPDNSPKGYSWIQYNERSVNQEKWASYITNDSWDGSTMNKTWTIAEANSPYFGIGFNVYNPDSNSDIAYVYQVELTLHYELIPPVINYIYPSGGAKLSRLLSSIAFTFNSKYVATGRVKVNGTARVANLYFITISGGAKFGGNALEALNRIYSEIASGGLKIEGQALEFANIISLVEIKIGGSITDTIIINDVVKSNNLYLSGESTNQIIIEEITYGGLSLSGNSLIGIGQEIFGSVLISGNSEISIEFLPDGGLSINGEMEIFATYDIDDNLTINGLIALSFETDVYYVAECEVFGGSSLSGESEFNEIFTIDPTSGSLCNGEAEVVYSGLLFGGMSISGEAEVVLEMMTPIDSNGAGVSGESETKYNALINVEPFGILTYPFSVRSIESKVLGGCNVGGSAYNNKINNLTIVLGSCFLNGSNQNNQTFNHPPDFGGIIVFARFRPSYLRYYEKRNLKICLSLNSETLCNKVIPDPKKTIMNKTGYDQDIATNMFQVEISSGWCDFNDSCQNAYLPAIVKNRQGKYLPEKSRRYSIQGQIATMN
jgi:hypothetical protein